MEQLILTKVEGYAVRTTDDERSSSIKGYYKTYHTASKAAEGTGWYGSNGTVEPTELYEDSNGNIYVIKYTGKYTDVAKKEREELIESINSKLTTEELELLKKLGYGNK